MIVNKNRYKSFGKLLLITLNICISSFYIGYIAAHFSSIHFPILIEYYNIKFSPSFIEGLLIGFMPIGAGIGSYLSYIIIERLSRRWCLLFSNILALVVGIFLFIPNVYTLLIVRILQGICAGFYSVCVPLYVKQFTPLSITGIMGIFHQLMIVIGIISVYAFLIFFDSIYQSEQQFWHYIFGFPLLILIFQSVVLLFIFPYETVKYFITHDRSADAIALIQQIYQKDKVQEVYQEYLPFIENSPIKNNNAQLEIIDGQKQLFPNNQPNIQNKLTIYISLTLSLSQQMTGVNIVVFYGVPIAESVLPSIKHILPLLINTLGLFAVIAAVFLIERLGRKQILQFGTLIVVVSLAMITFGYLGKLNTVQGEGNSHLSIFMIVFGLFVFMFAFNLSLGPIIWLYIPEIVQPQILPYTTMLNWFSASGIIILFPFLTKLMPYQNEGFLFLFFLIWTMCYFFFMSKILIETKGKTQKQIIRQYQNMKICK